MEPYLSRRKFLISSLLLLPPYRFLAGVMAEEQYFRHGVASGDPLQDRVIIWTRISDVSASGKEVEWEAATDDRFRYVIRSGSLAVSASADDTVKVDVTGLQPGTIYYYRFKYKDRYSPVGCTITLPERLDREPFRIGVVSCNNWEDGYFNAFRFLAGKKEVDLVLHLGDYIYEYGTGEYGDISIGRINDPDHELITLQDYRKRYALYRTDPDLQLLHARKPFYAIWDDHEIANDSYMDGAKNHQEGEGPWMERRTAAVQAYLEWMPVRAKNVAEMKRKISIGKDVDILFPEERLQGRTKQVNEEDLEFYNKKRYLLGDAQAQWLKDSLKNSKATWTLIANQVMFTGYAVADKGKVPKYNDWWVGYPYERKGMIDFLKNETTGNVIFLTGDHHQSFVLALHDEPEWMKYTKSYKEKPLAWELLTPSITSKNADRLEKDQIAALEAMLGDEHVNPHLKYVDVKSHGYYIVSVSKEQLIADYYFVDNLRSRAANESKAASFIIDAEHFTIQNHE